MPEQNVYKYIEIINIINKYELNQLNISCVHFNCENDKAVILTCLMTCFSLEQNQKVIIYRKMMKLKEIYIIGILKE